LHLDDELFAAFGFTENIEDRLAIQRNWPELLGVAKIQRFNPVFLRQKRVQKIDQQVFIRLFAEQPFETEIRVGIDVSGHDFAPLLEF